MKRKKQKNLIEELFKAVDDDEKKPTKKKVKSDIPKEGEYFKEISEKMPDLMGTIGDTFQRSIERQVYEQYLSRIAVALERIANVAEKMIK